MIKDIQCVVENVPERKHYVSLVVTDRAHLSLQPGLSPSLNAGRPVTTASSLPELGMDNPKAAREGMPLGLTF